MKIDVIGSAFLGQTYKISNSGKISVPLLGTIQAEGLTAEELESEIGKQLKEEQLLKSPEVLVYIDSYEAKPIYVVGEVDYPGEYVMSQQLTLMDAIFLAGGLDFTASRFGYLHRRLSEDAASKLPAAGLPITTKPLFNVLTGPKSSPGRHHGQPGNCSAGHGGHQGRFAANERRGSPDA